MSVISFRASINGIQVLIKSYIYVCADISHLLLIYYTSRMLWKFSIISTLFSFLFSTFFYFYFYRDYCKTSFQNSCGRFLNSNVWTVVVHTWCTILHRQHPFNSRSIYPTTSNLKINLSADSLKSENGKTKTTEYYL